MCYPEPKAGQLIKISFSALSHPKERRFCAFLMLNGRGLPPNTPLLLAVNGLDVGTLTSDKNGHVSIRKTPAGKGGKGGKNGKGGGGGATLPPTVNLFTIFSVTLHDASSNVLLSVNF